MTAVVMLLCDRLDAALQRITDLETQCEAMAVQLESRRRHGHDQERANAQGRRRIRDERDAERAAAE
jgi:hypothetical protein